MENWLEICKIVAIIVISAAVITGVVGGVAILKDNNKLACISHIVLCLCTALIMFLTLVVVALKVSLGM